MMCPSYMLFFSMLILAIIGKSAKNDVPKNKIKVPVPVNISGVIFCNYIAAYAVLINIVEEVSCLFFCNL